MQTKPLILVVESNPESLIYLDVNLSNMGFDVISAPTSEEALQLASSHGPKAIICAFNMQPISGIEFCKILRQNKYLSNTPFLLLSNDQSDNVKTSAFEQGVDAFEPASLTIRVLAARVNALIKRFNRPEEPGQEEIPGDCGFCIDLTFMPLVEILQFLNLAKKSGRFSLSSTGVHNGTITLKNGEICHAETGNFTGEEALYRMVLWQEGLFTVMPQELGSTLEWNISESTAKLLLNCCSVLDMENVLIKT